MTDMLTAEPERRAAADVERCPRLVVADLTLRASVRSGALWGLVFAGYIAVQVLAYASAYPSARSRDELLAAYGHNVGLNALIGPAHAINTVDGYAAWRLLGVLSIVGSLWGLLIATRLARGEEDSGRVDLMLAGLTTRRGAAAQTAVGLGAGLLALFLATAASTVLVGNAHTVRIAATDAMFFSVTLVAGAAAFLAVGLLASQLASSRRRATTYAGGIFAAAYALRMVADSDATLHWLVWLTPLGWIEESRPLTDPHPAALVPLLAFVITVVTCALSIAGRRDIGSGVIAERTTAPPRLSLLHGPLGLTIRLSRATTIGWLLGITLYSLLVGSVARGATQNTTRQAGLERALSRLGDHGSLIRIYLGLTFLLVALALSLVAGSQMTSIRAEEASGRLVTLLAGPVRRTSWLAGRLALSSVAIVVGAVIAGVATWIGATAGHASVGLGELALAGVNAAPPALVVLGVGALVFGVRPRMAVAATYGYLGWSFLVEFLGAVVNTNHWLMDTSILFHVVPAPASNPNWARCLAMVVAAALLTLGGVATFSRRDLTDD